MPPELSGIDWTALLKSPLAGGIPLAVGVGLLVWVITEASSFFVPTKWRPLVALMLGPFFGWLTAAAEVLDFGDGPASWLRALLYGIVGGALAVLAHDHIKDRFPFNLLTRVTPGAVPPAGPAGGGA
jgi:hypothetical protein